MNKFSDKKIIESWQRNVAPWVKAVRTGEIASRSQVTNQAIVAAVLQCAPTSVLDLGCGEGWLVRELAANNVSAYGIDAIAELIAAAEQMGVGRFRQLAYEAVTAETLTERFDCLVANFSLLGDHSVLHLFAQAPALLKPAGAFIVQTVHPVLACGDAAYVDGWREGSWLGFDPAFSDPAPWYFRTIESWQALFRQHGFADLVLVEPVYPESGQAASIILTGKLKS